MFDNIIADEEIDFNEIENKVYDFVCKLGCSILKEILETIDERIKSTRSRDMRNKGKRKSCVKTIMGVVEYERRVYVDNEEKGKKCRYLLDEKVKMFATGKISNNLMEKALDMVVQTTSYRKAANETEQLTRIQLSHETMRNITIRAGEEIEKKEQEMVRLYKEKKLAKGEKETPILFEEADGLWINLQGKDRKEQIERNKKEYEKTGKEYVPPKRIKSELKLHESYEGWKKDSNRHEVVNKMYIAGFLSTTEIRNIRSAKIYSNYNEDKIKYRIINGDGAQWINKLADKKMIRQKDKFHIYQAITRSIEIEKYRNELIRMFDNKEYKSMTEYIENLKYEIGGEEKQVKKLEYLKMYLSKDLERYTDIIDLPEAPEGIEYRNMGTMESQIFTIFSKRFKGRKAFSKKGATYLAKVSALFKERKNNIKIEEIKNMVKKDPYEDYADKYIKVLENKYKKNYDAYIATKGKTKEGIQEKHTLKNYNVNEKFEPYSIKAIKDIIKYENNSEMACWPTFFGAHKTFRNVKHN